MTQYNLAVSNTSVVTPKENTQLLYHKTGNGLPLMRNTLPGILQKRALDFFRSYIGEAVVIVKTLAVLLIPPPSRRCVESHKNTVPRCA